jgi:predicted outer membrane protein
MAIADAGHSLTQVSHPVHLLLSTMATNSFTPSYMLGKREKKGFDWNRKTGADFDAIYAENEIFYQK